MGDFGILIPSRNASPVAVSLRAADGELVLVRGDGREEFVAFRNLFRMLEEGPQLRLGRRGVRGWELRTGGDMARVLSEQIPRRWRRLHWGAARAWHVAIFVTSLVVIELVKLPAEWLAALTPHSFERRLIPADLRSQYGSYCHSIEGERAIRDLIRRFDPNIAKSVRIEVLNEGLFVMSALPDDRLIIYKPMLAEIEPDEFAALLAHEVAHLQKRDAVEAALRANGTLGALLGNVAQNGHPDGVVEFSAEQEGAADRAALELLMRANISPLPAANLFDRMEQARKQNDAFGKDQYYLHYGFYPDRARRWRDVPAKGWLQRAGHAMSAQQEDAVFNYCWHHTGPPRTSPPKHIDKET